MDVKYNRKERQGKTAKSAKKNKINNNKIITFY